MKPPAGFREHRIALEWGEIATVDNRSKAPAMFAIHGWLDNASSFYRLARELPKQYRWILADLAGHGCSDPRPVGARYDLLDYPLDLIGVIEALGLQRLQLLGHSLGGAVALLVAGMIPERIDRVILIDSLGPLPTKPEPVTTNLMRHYRAHRDLRTKKMPIYPSVRHAAEARARVSDLSVDLGEELLARSLRPVEGGFSWRSDPRLRLPIARPIAEDEVTLALRTVQCPVLLIRAKPGFYREDYPMDSRSRELQHLTKAVVDGGHHVHMESARAIAEVIQDHQKKLETLKRSA